MFFHGTLRPTQMPIQISRGLIGILMIVLILHLKTMVQMYLLSHITMLGITMSLQAMEAKQNYILMETMLEQQVAIKLSVTQILK
jgi:hypothetical protein